MRALFIRAIPVLFVLPLLTASGAAQERCKWSAESDPGSVSSYPKQLNIDVGDAPGHIVGVYELHTIAGPNAKPNCEGVKDKERWEHGLRDYRDRNGRLVGYAVTILESGDKIYQEISGTVETRTAADGSIKTTYDGVETGPGAPADTRWFAALNATIPSLTGRRATRSPQALRTQRTGNTGSRNSRTGMRARFVD